MEEAAVVSRSKAWSLLCGYTQSPSLLKHGLAVEACMAAWGRRRAEEFALPPAEAAAAIELYQATGLLHDFDYERYPSAEEHPCG